MLRRAASLGKLVRPHIRQLRCDGAFGGKQTEPQRQLQLDFAAVADRALRQRMQQAETALEMGNRFEVSQSRCGILPRLQPLLDRAFGVAGRRQVMGEQLRLALDEIGEMPFQRRPRRAHAIPAVGRATGRVSSILHQRVLEQVQECGAMPRQNRSPASPSWSNAACNSLSGRRATGSISS